jgi:uncharacterized protein
MNYIAPRRSDGTIQNTRGKQPWPKDRLFRILSIDGGGIKGVFPAAYLAELERRFLNGTSIANHFDMIAGTSTGGIIALALAKGMSASEAMAIYTKRGHTIFPKPKKSGAIRQTLRWLFKAKHDQSALMDELLEVFGDMHVDDARNRLVIPSFEGQHGEPWIYKTPHHPDYKKDRHVTAARVALHTAAAPTIYAGVANDGHTMVDGGLWANNPVMQALVDVLVCYDLPRENIRILSIGTGDDLFSTADLQNAGVFGWTNPLRAGGPALFKAAVKAQSHNANGQAGLLIGKPHLVRIDPSEGNNPIELDDVDRAVRELPAVARSMAESSGHHVNTMFLGDLADAYIKCPVS